MTCAQVQSLLSSYLDGAVTGKQMFSLGQHLNECRECRSDYAGLRQTQAILSQVGRAPAPDDLSLRVRLAISREAARRREPLFGNLGIRAANALRAFMVPATAGVVATLLIFGVLMGFITPVQANTNDVPLLLSTNPELQQTGFGAALGAVTEDSLVIEAYVDANGRVQDYRILSDPKHEKDLPHPVKNMLIFTTFRPATLMGSPTPGTAVLSFSKVSVKG
jgi:hypothetical protein